MADKLGLVGEGKDLKLGDTFNKNYKDGAFHTIRCKYGAAVSRFILNGGISGTDAQERTFYCIRNAVQYNI